MEQQIDFLGRDKYDIKWELFQFRVSPEIKRDFQVWCHQHGINPSVFFRIVCNKVLNNCRQMPGVINNQEATKQMDIAVNEVVGYLPVISKQIAINRHLY